MAFQPLNAKNTMHLPATLRTAEENANLLPVIRWTDLNAPPRPVFFRCGENLTPKGPRPTEWGIA